MCVVIVVARRSFYTLSSTAHKSKHQVVPLKRLKTKENYFNNHHPRKVVAVAYQRWLFKTGSNSEALTGKTLAFLIGGHIYMEVRP